MPVGDLGVPVNWSAYEDIAKFFSEDVKEVDGKRVYGHMDYGKKDPSLGWRFTDAWFSMAGGGDYQQMQVGAAEKTNKQTITTGGADRQKTAPGNTRRTQFPGGHACQQQANRHKEQ